MRRIFLYGWVLTQLVACASIGPTKTYIDPDVISNNSSKVAAINEWRLVGRLSVRHPEDSWVVYLSWHHRLLTDDLLLSTALGGVVAKLFYDENQIIIEDADGDRRVVNEGELTSQLGYAPPLQHLKYWARGLPSPDLTVQFEKSSPAQRAFKQDGWDVTLEQFSDIKGVALPAKISLLKNKLKIKLVVDKWLE